MKKLRLLKFSQNFSQLKIFKFFWALQIFIQSLSKMLIGLQFYLSWYFKKSLGCQIIVFLFLRLKQFFYIYK